MVIDRHGRSSRLWVHVRRGLMLGLTLGLPIIAVQAEEVDEEIVVERPRGGSAKNPGAYVMRVHLRDSVTCLETRCALSFPCVHCISACAF
jgi:hypothetical protein